MKVHIGNLIENKMRIKIVVIISSFVFFLASVYGQEVSAQVKGDWVIKKFQSAGQFGMTNQMAEFYINDTITINKYIKRSLEENEYTKAAGVSPTVCEFIPLKNNRIEDPNKYFFDKFEIRPILLGIKESSTVVLIITNCQDEFFKEIYFDVENNKILLFTEGMFFILEKIGKQ